MRVRLPELQGENETAGKIRELSQIDSFENNERVLHKESILYVPGIIRTKAISMTHDNSPADLFGIDKTRQLITRIYYCHSFRADVEAYVKACDVYIAFKASCFKSYEDLQSLSIRKHG